jgi:hypothetical protein
MSTPPTKVTSTATFNGKELKFYSWTVNQGSYGSVSSFEIKTSLQFLRDSGLDIYGAALASVAPVPVEIFVTDQYGNADTQIFGGEYDRSEWHFSADEVVLTGRGWEGVLVDSKVILADQTVYFDTSQATSTPTIGDAPTSSFQITNMTILEFLEQVAEVFDFTLEVDDQYLDTTPLGTLVANFDVFTTSPKPVWDILVFLSRIASTSVPFEVYVTPDKFLHFQTTGIPGFSAIDPLTFTWNKPQAYIDQQNSVKADTVYPLMDLDVTHNPRRNSTFGVVVLSYHYATVSQQYGTLVYANDLNITANSAAWEKFGVTGPGFFAGKSPYGASNLLGDLGRPIYVFRYRQAMDRDAVIAEAWHQALDIAKKEILIEGVIDGIATLQMLTPFFIDGAASDLLGFNKEASGANGTGGTRTFYINHIEHSFSIPQDDEPHATEGAAAGYTVRFSAWTLPPNLAVTNQLSS